MKLQQILLCIFALFWIGTLTAQNIPTVQKSINLRQIKADFNQVKGPKSEVFNNCTSAGRAFEGLRSEWQRQLQEAVNDIGFKYIRFHGLLGDEMGVYTVNDKGEEVYNFQYVDMLFDDLLKIGIKPFVEFCFMPDALKSTDKLGHWYKCNVSPPKDMEKWGRLVEKLTRHLMERYGEDEVKTWYFEVWNEANHPYYFDGENRMATYFEMYKVSANAVKSVSKNLRVGGPASAGSAWVKEILEYCKANGTPIDFISTHAYGGGGIGISDNTGGVGKILSRMNVDPDVIAKGVTKTKGVIDETTYKNMELHYTEWNSTWAVNDPIFNTYQNAAYCLNTLKQTESSAKSMAYWTFTDIFEEDGPAPKSFGQGVGLMNLQGIKKPTYLAFKFLNMLGKTELVNSDKQSWVCKDNKGTLTVMTFNYAHHVYEKDENNQGYFGKLVPAALIGKQTIAVKNVPDGKYFLEEYRIGYRSNDIYSAYIDMGKPDYLTPVQVESLKKIGSGEPFDRKVITVSNNIVKLENELYENEIRFYKLSKLEK
jgi:xylan 1,4-beta-xylosidase